MAWSFGESWDLYAAAADMITGYWDSGAGTPTLVAGRFSGSNALQISATSASLTKSSATNDAVHHLVVAFRQTAAISGTTLGAYLQLLDGATVQCSIVFKSNGDILLTSGIATGTVLATYAGAFPVNNTWYAFEIEVVINNTTGSFKVRKNGNSTEDHSTTGLNTRGGTANNYANSLKLGMQAAVSAQQLDDLFWQSSAAAGTWLGDIRCFTRMPASDASVAFSKSPTNFLARGNTGASTAAFAANSVRASSVVAPTTGTVASLSFNLNAGVTGHVKMALYDNTGASSRSGALLASSAELTNPGAGVNTFTVTGGPIVTRGTTYWVAVWSDISITGATGSANEPIDTLALTYTTSFPATMTGASTSINSGISSVGMNITPFNIGCVNEPQQNAATDYVYSSTVGQEDFYGIASIASTPATVIACTTRGYMQKSDAGTRTAAVQLKSGATTVASSTLTLSSSGWLWTWRMDLTDPNTGSAWTAAAVNSAQIGPKCVA